MTIAFFVCGLQKTRPKMTVNSYSGCNQFFSEISMMKHAVLRVSVTPWLNLDLS